MISVTSQSGHVTYGKKDFTCDVEQDLINLPIDCTPGSTAFILETSDVFMLNNKHEWINLSTGKATDYSLPTWNGGKY